MRVSRLVISGALVAVLAGCSLNLTKSQKSDLENLCQNITLQALNERDSAIRADNQRRYDLLNSRMDLLERDDHATDQKLDELLSLAHQRLYRGH
jgi:uncharacterized lipoprotein